MPDVGALNAVGVLGAPPAGFQYRCRVLRSMLPEGEQPARGSLGDATQLYSTFETRFPFLS